MRKAMIRALSITALCFMLLVQVWGCSKRVASSSGDATSSAKDKTSAPVETILDPTMATIPDDRRSTAENIRAPLDGTPSMSKSGETTSLVSRPSTVEAPSFRGPSSLTRTEAMRLGDIFFDFDQYTISPVAQAVLEADANWIKTAGNKSILIEGHCDERGTEAYNLVLGEKRARSTKRYLEDLGVPGPHLKIVSFGEIRPFCKEHDENCYQKNRRAHFVAE